MNRKRERTTGEKELMSHVASEFGKAKGRLGAKKAAKEIGVCLASFYKYLRKSAIPRFEVLKQAHEKWGFEFHYIDFGMDNAYLRSRAKREGIPPSRQYLLPFIQGVSKDHVEIVKIGPQKPDSVELTIRIRFAG
jgi:DNA-binding phage protein